MALIGGAFCSIHAIFSFLVTSWVHTDYMKNMIGHLFMVKKHSWKQKLVEGNPTHVKDKTELNGSLERRGPE